MVLALGLGAIADASRAAEGDKVTMHSSLDADGASLLIEWSAPIKVLQKSEEQKLILRFSRSLSVDAGPALDILTDYLNTERTVIDGTDLTLHLRSDVSAKLELKDRKIVAINFDRKRQQIPDIKLKVSTLENGVRLTLDWPHPVSFDVKNQDKKLFATFDARNRLTSTDMDYLNKTLQPWFDEVRQTVNSDSMSLTFDLRQMVVSAVANRGERRIDIDLKRDASKPAPEVASNTTVDAEQAQPAKEQSVQKLPLLPKRRPKAIDEPVLAEKQITPQDPPASQAAKEQSVQKLPLLPKRRPKAIDEPVLAEKQIIPQDLSASQGENSVGTLIFDWKHSVGAAVFKRAGYLWVAFDTPPSSSRIPLPPPTPPSLMPGELIDADRATVIRFKVIKDTPIEVLKDPTGRWLIRSKEAPPTIKSVPIIPTSNARTLRASAHSNGRVIRVDDPLVGDQIAIWPILKPAVGHETPRRLVDMQIFSSFQGLAWRPLRDEVVTNAKPYGLEFSRAGGLTLSSSSKGEALDTKPLKEGDQLSRRRSTNEGAEGTTDAPRGDQSEDPTPPSYLAFAGSNVERELVAETRRILRQAILKAPPEGKDQARLNLAKLLVAEKLASEAKIVLSRISDDSRDVITTSSQALRGASALLTNDLDEASTLLGSPQLDDDNEIKIWRAALDAREQNWEAAAEGWKASSNHLDDYPIKLRLEFGLLALESAIKLNDENMIRKGLRRLKHLDLSPYETARVDRLRAKVALQDGDVERAEEILRTLVDGRYPSLSTLADFELASLVQRQNPDSLQHLALLKERLPVWRGHRQEVSMIDELAKRYRDANNPGEALRLWGYLSRIHPRTEKDDVISEARKATYIDALTKLAGNEIDLLEAYSIYLDFIEFLPNHTENNSVHRDLAQHLAGLDLLEEAVLVLRPILEVTEDDEERLQVGIEMADHLLVLNRTNEALTTLDRLTTAQENSSKTLEDEWKVSRARALVQLDRSDEALRLIQDLRTSAALHVRATIFWQKRNWNRLVSTIETILDDPAQSTPLDDEAQKLVLRLALARDELGQTEQLNELQQRYAAEMASGPWSGAFALVTQPQSKPESLAAALKQAENQLVEFSEFRKSATMNR
ncbi:MAG: tetratricopeptide repeat protein [Geminicoccales bacterium]